MTMPSEGFVFDAVALIDYAKVSMDSLGLVSRTLGRINVPLPVLKEAKQMTVSDCGRQDILIVEPELAELLAASSTPGPLSVQDWLCLGLARRESLTCVTADRRLRRECIERGVATIWTLTPLEKLVAVGSLAQSDAVDIARGFQRINPAITQDIVDRFEAKLCA